MIELYSSTWSALDNLTLSFPRLPAMEKGQHLWSTSLCWELFACCPGPAPPTKDFMGPLSVFKATVFPDEKAKIQLRPLRTSGSILYNLCWVLCEARILFHIPICGPSWSLGGEGIGWAYAWQSQGPHCYGNGWTARYSRGESRFNCV